MQCKSSRVELTTELVPFVAIDIETTGLIVDNEPPHILCVVTRRLNPVTSACLSNEVGVGIQYELGEIRTWPEREDLENVESMSHEKILNLVDYLWTQTNARLLAWNGVGYDFRVIWMHCCRMNTDAGNLAAEHMVTMALSSCDPMLNFTYQKGFPIKLAAVAELLPVPMHKTGEGVECERLWFAGGIEDRQGVIDYCENDVNMTCAVFMHIQNTGDIRWKTSKGRQSVWTPKKRKIDVLAPCEDVMKWNFENNDFMRKGCDGKIDKNKKLPTAEQFTGWLEK